MINYRKKYNSNKEEDLIRNNTNKKIFDDEFDLPNENVDVLNNTIYFYSEINRNSILSLNKKIKELNITLKNKQNELSLEKYPNINLNINSHGGDLFDSLAGVNTIKSSDVPIVSIIDGVAASGASILSVVCNKRYMKKYSLMLIHQLSTGFMGKYHEMCDEFENDTLLMDMLKNIYLEHSFLNEETLDALLKRDIWLDANKALEYGLIDKII